MVTAPAAPITLEEFSKLPRGEKQYEVSEGELLTMAPPKSLYSRMARAIFKRIEALLEKIGAAEAYLEAGYILFRDPLTIRQPDVSVLSNDRILATPDDSYFEGAPELAVEIVSPSDSAEDLELKAKHYLQAGGGEVWVLYPKSRHIYVFTAGNAVKVLEGTDILESPAILPGFSVKVSDLFLQ